MRGLLLIGIFSLGLLPGLTFAGSLLRCVGPDGVPQYVQRKPAGASCSAVKPAPPPPTNPYRPTASIPKHSETKLALPAEAIPNWTPGPINPATLSPTGQTLPASAPGPLPPLPMGPASSATLPPVNLPPLPDTAKR